MTLDELIIEGERILADKFKGSFGYYVNNEVYDPWKRKALMFLQQAFPKRPQVATFEEHVATNNDDYHCVACLAFLKSLSCD